MLYYFNTDLQSLVLHRNPECVQMTTFKVADCKNYYYLLLSVFCYTWFGHLGHPYSSNHTMAPNAGGAPLQ